jgi:P4 family phage/plasmid primase-like protien
VPRDLEILWKWARGYIKRFGWALAPVWNPVDAVPRAATEGMVGCCCKDGEACTTWGKHLVSGLGVARQEDEVELVWPAGDIRVRSGFIGIAVLTGSDSQNVVLDVGEHAPMTKARFKVTDHVLTQTTPTGGQHWFFRIGEAEAVTGGRSEIELVTGVWVLGDGAFSILPPRAGYHWADGAKAAMAAGITEATDALKMRLTQEGLIHGIDAVERDAAWRTRPGTPLVGGAPRTYTRRGDVRRLVDVHGDKILYTPGLGWKCWTESGWGGPERSETMIKSMVMGLPDVHLAEGRDSKARGDDTLSKDAYKWAGKSQHRATAAIYGDLQTDERVLVPSAKDWDAEGWIAGLPVTSGVGRLVDLSTGESVLDARTRRVSRSLGASYEDGPGGSLKHLWELGLDGQPGKWFVKYVTDLEAQMGTDAVRLLQRAAGASLYGRQGVTGDTDAVFVLKGPARSGKSTFAECLLKVAGQYGKAQNHNLLFGDRGNPEFTDAAIFGYRVMTLSEPPMHAELNTTKLKQLSGGDSITGRLPYGREEISFTPECTLWLMTNHALEVTDEAVWRRMKFFQFSHSFEGTDEMPALRKALTQDEAELRLALAWMLAGAAAWAREGWGDTTTWNEITAEEKAKHNVIEKWVSDMVVITGSVVDEMSHAEMMTSFQMWLSMNGEDKPNMTKNALRDECEGACIRAGMTYDRYRKRLVGGHL